MFNIDECVAYGAAGVCRICDKRFENFCGEKKEYYILKPVYGDASTIYVPVDNKELTDKMKRVISADAIYELIEKMPELQIDWIENDRERNQKYTDILKENNYVKTISLIKTLYLKKIMLEQSGKKFRVQDKKLLEISEKVLYEEFAQALDIEPSQVVDFIKSRLEDTTNS